MRDPQPGNLLYEWQDFEFKGLAGIINMRKEMFEDNFGEFEAMILPQGQNKPYAVWSRTHVVLFLNEDKYGIASITREPSEYIFG